MNFNVYVDKRTGEQLRRLAQARGVTRNWLIRKALEHLLEREQVSGWPQSVIEHCQRVRRASRLPRFESYRGTLRAPAGDPLR